MVVVEVEVVVSQYNKNLPSLSEVIGSSAPDSSLRSESASSLKEHFLWDMNNTKWCNGFYIEFRQSLAKETFSYDEHLKS